MTDDAYQLARDAGVLAHAASLSAKHGDAKTALALEQLAQSVREEAASLRRDGYWTGSHPGDTFTP